MRARTWPFWSSLGDFKKRMYQTMEGGQSLTKTINHEILSTNLSDDQDRMFLSTDTFEQIRCSFRDAYLVKLWGK